MKCQFALFIFYNTRARRTALKIFQPPRRHSLDAGFELPERSCPDVYVDYLQPLTEYQQLPPFALLRYFEHQAQCYLQFCPLACPSPTSLKSGKYYYQCFDPLLGIPQDNFSMILGNAIHYTIYQGLFDETPEGVFDSVYYGQDLFLEDQEQDYLSPQAREQYIQLCREQIARFREFGCDIVNEKHVISQVLGLQGKIDIYGISSDTQIVIELKTRSTPFNKEDHNKQLALYVYESLGHAAPRLYCEVIGVLQDSGGLYFPNGEGAASRQAFLNYSEKKHRQLLNFLNLLIMDRNIYVLSYFLLLCYIENAEKRYTIAALLLAFAKRYSATTQMLETLGIIDNLLTPFPVYQEELLCVKSRIRQLLSLDLHYSVADAYLRLYDKRRLAVQPDKQLGAHIFPDFECAYYAVWLVSHERFANGYFEYDVVVANGDVVFGKYRLFELENDGTVRRCYIFSTFSYQACRGTSKLDCELTYLAVPLVYQPFRGVGLFSLSESRLVYRSQLQEACVAGAYSAQILETNPPGRRLLVSETAASTYAREFKATGDYDTDRQKYYASQNACVVVRFDDFVAKQAQYSGRELFVETELSDAQLAYCVLSRASCFLSCRDEPEFERALGRLRSNGVRVVKASLSVFEAEDFVDLTSSCAFGSGTLQKGPKIVDVIDID